MFDLDQAISEWRRQMTAGGAKSPEILNELESHLRDDVEQRMHSGLAAKQAFEVAVRQMGPVEVLNTEFAKVKGRDERLRLTLKVTCCVGFVGIIVLASGAFRVGMNLGAGTTSVAGFVLPKRPSKKASRSHWIRLVRKVNRVSSIVLISLRKAVIAGVSPEITD